MIDNNTIFTIIMAVPIVIFELLLFLGIGIFILTFKLWLEVGDDI